MDDTRSRGTVPNSVLVPALDAKVLIFKKKRWRNYRRTRGHRQELTKLRITDIQGVEKPEVVPILKTEKKGAKKVAVTA
ncbi:50S ribosomal protein L21 [Capsicum chinense]|nr:50S ribosomal protein L21 [Capsicum chinense]